MQKIIRSVILLILLLPFAAKSQTPSILWRFNTHDMSFGNAATDDLLGDGKLEIAFSCYWGDSNIYVVHAEDGTLLWKANMGGCNDAAPIIYDVFGNGKKEIILASSCNPVLTCFDGANGNIIWQTAFGGSWSGHISLASCFRRVFKALIFAGAGHFPTNQLPCGLLEFPTFTFLTLGREPRSTGDPCSHERRGSPLVSLACCRFPHTRQTRA